MLNDLYKIIRFSTVCLLLLFFSSASKISRGNFAPAEKGEIIKNCDNEKCLIGYIIELNMPPLAVKYAELKEKYSQDGLISESEIQRMEKEQEKHYVKIIKEQEKAISKIARAAPSLVGEKGEFRKERTYFNVLNGFSIKLISNEEKKRIESLGYKIHPDYLVKAVFSMQQVIPAIKADTVFSAKDVNCASVYGDGIKIGILDTGIDYTHPEFGSCTIAMITNGTCAKISRYSYDFYRSDTDPFDDSFVNNSYIPGGHGTAVASAAAGKLTSVARNAVIYAYKVGEYSNGISVGSFISAMDRVVNPDSNANNSDHLDVINISWGKTSDQATIKDALTNAINAGVVVVTAVGNQTNSHCDPNSTIYYPSAHSEVIAVGSTDINKTWSSFNCYGSASDNAALKKPDIVATGELVCLAKVNNFNMYGAGSDNTGWFHPPDKPGHEYCNDSNYILGSGTSFSAPITAGAVALLKQMHPNWTPLQLRTMIYNTATVIANTYPGYRFLNIGQAVSDSSDFLFSP